jgi:hypothetical protein
MILFDRMLEAELIHGASILEVGNAWGYGDNIPMLRAVPIKIDNIMKQLDADIKYYSRLLLNPPKSIPPFEYSFLDSYATGPNLKISGRRGVHVGCFKDKEAEIGFERLLRNKHHRNLQYQSFKEMNAKYMLAFTFFEEDNRGIIIRSPGHICFLNGDGNRVEDSGLWIRTIKDFDDDYEERKESQRLWVHICLFIFSLMNCKNTIVIKEDAPVEEQGKRIKQVGHPLVTYRIIKIDQVLTKHDSRHRPNNGFGYRPLHLCRGHFATYSAEKPLFGRYAGTFWKPQHIRGREKYGAVIKEYEF